MKEYKTIPGHSEYQISEDGEVIRIKGPRIKEPKIMNPCFHVVKGKEYPNGYWYVGLRSKDYTNQLGENVSWIYSASIAVHRLVAFTYLTNDDPLNKTTVNHIDGDKLNNHYTNLEWCSMSDNIQHSYSILNRKTYKGSEHWRHGKKNSKEAKLKQSFAKLGEKHPKFKGYYINSQGTKYTSIRSASLCTGIDQKVLARAFKQGKNLNYGWQFEPKKI